MLPARIFLRGRLCHVQPVVRLPDNDEKEEEQARTFMLRK